MLGSRLRGLTEADGFLCLVNKAFACCQLQNAIPIRGDFRAGQLSFVPRQIDAVSTAGSQPSHAAVLPFGRQGGKQAQKAFMALHQHFRNTGGEAKVAVDLEGRMVIQQVFKGGMRQQETHIFACFFAIQQPCPEVDDPRAAPTGVAAAMGEPALQRAPCGCEGLRLLQGDLLAGIEGKQVRNVAMPQLGFLL